MLTKDIAKADFIELLGLDSLSGEVQDQLLTMAVRVIEARTLNRILDQLGDDGADADQFSSVLESGDADAVKRFLDEKDIDLVSILQEEVQQLKQEEFAKLGKKKPSST